MLLRGGRREALFDPAPEFEPAEFEVLGVIDDGSCEPEGEGVSLMDTLSGMSSMIADSLIMAESV